MNGVISNFKKQITANGISQSDIKLLEDTLGEKVISSSINMKSFTTERSEISVSDALSVLEHYVPETSTSERVFTSQEYFTIFNDFVVSLQQLSKVLSELTTSYNEDKKNTLFNLKHRWSWNNSDGSGTENAVYDMFSKKYEMSQILNNGSLISEACGDKAEEINFMIRDFLYNLEKRHENHSVNWEVGGYDTFITMGLITNEEIRSYIYNMSFVPTKLNGEDFINFLDNSYKHYEYVLEVSKCYKNDYIDTFSRNASGNNTYIGENKSTLERMIFLTNKNAITINFLNIVKAIFNSMSNQ